MSTQGYIAVPHGDSWRARYVHSDGYPTWLGRHVWAIINREDLTISRWVLTERHYGWSQINSEQENGECARLGNRADVVPKWGIAYTHEEQLDEWVTPNQLDSWDWAYVLGDSELLVIKGSTLLGAFPWDGDEPDWNKIENG